MVEKWKANLLYARRLIAMTSTTLVVVNINKEMVSFARSARQHYRQHCPEAAKKWKAKKGGEKRVVKGGRIV